MIAYVACVVALAAGCVLGRVRPWQRLGGWAEDQLRFGGWARGGACRQAVVLLALVVTAPCATWRAVRRPAPAPAPAPAPEVDPHWVANRTNRARGGGSS